MVHPDFVNQQVPRPTQWEVPQLANLADFWTTPSALRDSITEHFRHALLQFPYYRRRAFICFLRSIPDFVGLAEWEPHRLLGAGSFGLAGLWERKDTQGGIVDELVIKKVLGGSGTTGLYYTDSGGHEVESLLAEAVIQKLLNDHKCANVVHLRGYKFCTNNPLPAVTTRSTAAAGGGGQQQVTAATSTSDDEYRFYMEYAPYGSLERLKKRYRAWSQWLPEAFLWHLFECLIHAVLAMMTKPANQQFAGRRRRWHRDAEIIHLDIKPDNIFLGYETPMDNYTVGGGENLPYPTVQLGDYGLAEITHHEDNHNPRYFWGAGTAFYKTPEMLHYGIGFRRPPNGIRRRARDRNGRRRNIRRDEEEDDDPGFRFLVESNVWAIGKVMYDLATLSDSNTFHDHWATTEAQYRNNNNNHVIPEFQQGPFQWSTTDPTTTNPYSHRLMDTIGKCLTASISDRIDIQTLLGIVSQEISTLDHDPANRPPHGRPRDLYYAGNDINNMPLGPVPFPTTQREYETLMQDWTADPSWRPLQPPPAKWQAQITDAINFPVPNMTRNRFNIRQGRIWFANAPPHDPGTLRRSSRLRNRDRNRNQNGNGNGARP